MFYSLHFIEDSVWESLSKMFEVMIVSSLSVNECLCGNWCYL